MSSAAEAKELLAESLSRTMGCANLESKTAALVLAVIRELAQGRPVERDAVDGRRARLRVGRAERMWVTHAACGAGRDELGPRLEALVVYGEEPRLRRSRYSRSRSG